MKKFIAVLTSIVLTVSTCLFLSVIGADKKSGFSDISDGFWANDEIVYLTEIGGINGYEDGTFKPDNNVTREELAKLLETG